MSFKPVSSKLDVPALEEAVLKLWKKEKIFENGFSTKSKNKLERGYGLYIVKQLVNKNKGSIEVNDNDNKTEFLIIFKHNKTF